MDDMHDPQTNTMTLISTAGRETLSITVTDLHSLEDALPVLERFLRASGFCFDGELGIRRKGDREAQRVRQYADMGEMKDKNHGGTD